jgi:hypothetical protein
MTNQLTPDWIDNCLRLERIAREQPIHVAHIKLLLLIYQNPNTTRKGYNFAYLIHSSFL